MDSVTADKIDVGIIGGDIIGARDADDSKDTTILNDIAINQTLPFQDKGSGSREQSYSQDEEEKQGEPINTLSPFGGEQENKGLEPPGQPGIDDASSVYARKDSNNIEQENDSLDNEQLNNYPQEQFEGNVTVLLQTFPAVPGKALGSIITDGQPTKEGVKKPRLPKQKSPQQQVENKSDPSLKDHEIAVQPSQQNQKNPYRKKIIIGIGFVIATGVSLVAMVIFGYCPDSPGLLGCGSCDVDNSQSLCATWG